MGSAHRSESRLPRLAKAMHTCSENCWAGHTLNTVHSYEKIGNKHVQSNNTNPSTGTSPLQIGETIIAVVGVNKSLLHAVRWLSGFGCSIVGAGTVAEAR